jgi:hypothetical protein
MARADEIRAAAKITLEKYKADPNYLYIVKHYKDFTPKTRAKLYIDNVIGYVTGLEGYIKEDKLVDMRRHEHYERYSDSFESCARKMQQAPPEVNQQSMFSILNNNTSDETDEDDFDGDGNEEFDEPEPDVGEDDFDEDESKENAATETEQPPPNKEPLRVTNEVKTERRGTDDKVKAVAIPAQSIRVSPNDNIPDELKGLNQWCVFRTYPDKEKIGKLKKAIISPVNSAFAQSDTPESWVSYAQAKAYMERYNHYNGLVFALSKGIVFIDIDHAIKDGEIVSPEAKRLLELLPDTYTEKSVSGTGIHILLKGGLPDDAYRRNNEKGIEMYDNRRFICITGNTINGSREIKDYSGSIADIAYEFAGKRPPRMEYTATPATQSDTELIDRIFRSRSGAKFQALYRGDTSAYPSHSHAESAMVWTLAWWTQNPAQIDGIVRSSGLIRPKWDERRGSGTYGSMLIDEALSTVQPPQELFRSSQKQSYL